MPKRDDIQTILVVGSGPIIIGQAQNLIMQVRKHVLLLKKRDIESS